MLRRIDINEIEPAAFKGLLALEGYLGQSALTGAQRHLLKIRASQINKCAYCIDMHTKEALKHGETIQRIFLLDAWQETDVFSDEEKVILQMTEEITLVHQHGLSEDTYNRALQFFDEHVIAQLIMAIVSINAWNRIAVSTNKGFGLKKDLPLSSFETHAHEL